LSVALLVYATANDWDNVVQYKVFGGVAPSTFGSNPIAFLGTGETYLPARFRVNGIVRSVKASFYVAEHISPTGSPPLT
jgi:hypothetical protein